MHFIPAYHNVRQDSILSALRIGASVLDRFSHIPFEGLEQGRGRYCLRDYEIDVVRGCAMITVRTGTDNQDRQV
jgi:hypothetical protein